MMQMMTHIIGMIGIDADNMRYREGRDPIERLQSAGILGFFRPEQLEDAGLSRHQLPSLIRSGKVTRIGRGLYRIASTEPTEDYSLAMAMTRVPNSIVCLLSALRVHGIGSQAPAEVWLAIPHKAHPPRLSEVSLRVVRFSGQAWTLGVQETNFEGVPARITSPARTVADCFRFAHVVGRETAMEALQDGLRQRKMTVAELARVEDILPSRRLAAALDMRSI
jgi:predicted transcriptional regulator of viral defense system